MIRRLSFASSLVVAMLACTGTETGNPSFRGQAALTARTSDPTVAVIGGPSGGGAVVSSVWVSLGEIALGRCTSTDEDLAVAGPVAIELAPEAELHAIEVRENSWCHLDAPFAVVTAPLPVGAPAELAGRTAVIAGERADGVAFRVLARREASVRLKTSDASPLPVSSEQPSVLIAYDVAAWLAGVDLTSATVGPDGSITIDETSNATLLATIEAQLAAAVTLHVDSDGDGRLDPEEATPVAMHGP